MIARDAVREFQLTRVPQDFLDDPYPWYAALREHDPVHALEGGGRCPRASPSATGESVSGAFANCRCVSGRKIGHG